MSKGNWRHIVTAGLMVLCIGAKAHAEHHNTPRQYYGHNPPALATLIVHEAGSNLGTDTPKGCRGTSHPDVPCDAASAKASEDQARDALSQAWAAWCAVGVGFLTLIAVGLAAFYAKRAAEETKRSANAAIDQVKLSREEFNATHRPKLRVRRIMTVERHNPLIIRTEISNIGDGVAKIVAVGQDIFICGHEISPIYNAVPQEQELPMEIAPGTQLFLTFHANEYLKALWNASGDKRFWLNYLGVVAYEDIEGVRRTVTFFRYFNDSDGRYKRAIEDSEFEDFEYED